MRLVDKNTCCDWSGSLKITVTPDTENSPVQTSRSNQSTFCGWSHLQLHTQTTTTRELLFGANTKTMFWQEKSSYIEERSSRRGRSIHRHFQGRKRRSNSNTKRPSDRRRPMMRKRAISAYGGDVLRAHSHLQGVEFLGQGSSRCQLQ